jgi:WbqC-like protein
MSKKIAILQSNYIPWKGYFDLINMVDEFVFFDEVQYTKNDWRNRNKIKTSQGAQWLTIPVKQKSLNQKICETEIVVPNWNQKHWRAIQLNYSNTSNFNEYREIFEKLYLDCNEMYLSEVNYKFIEVINRILGIKTKIRWSTEFDLAEERTEKILGICKDCNASIYLSGPAAKGYLNEELIKKNNIDIKWMDYNGYSEYKQLSPPFEHEVTILDLIFNEGPNACKYMKSFGGSK